MNGTERRQQIKNFISDYHKQHHIAPTLDEIAQGIGLSGKGAVSHHVKQMLADGELSGSSGKPRTLVVVD